MKCNHCDICRKKGGCTKDTHVCFLETRAKRDITPVKWEPGQRS